MYDYPLIPIVQYDPNNPPFIPSIQVPQDIAYIVPYVAGSLINEIGLKASTNKARMFTYNVLVTNNWQNQNFSELFKVVMDHINYNYRKGLNRTPEQAIPEVIQKVTTLYSSDIIFRDENLKSMCSPEMINLAMQNMQAYMNMKKELAAFTSVGNNMQFQPQPYMGGNAHSSMYGAPASNSRYMNVQPMHNQSGVFQDAISSGTSFYNSNNPNNPRSSQTGRDYHNPHKQDNFSIKQTDYFDKKPIPEINIPIQNTPLPQEIKEGTEMDREQHTITTFNDTYSFNNTRFSKLAKSVSIINKQYLPSDNIVLYKNYLFESNLDTALTVGRIKQIDTQKEEFNNNIFRVFVKIANPILSFYDLKAYFAALKKADSFISLASIIQNLINTLQTKSDMKNYTDYMVAILSKMDNILTKIINDYLTNKLELKVSIDNFTTDIADLYEFIYKKYGNNYKNLLIEFENELLDILFLKKEENASSIETIIMSIKDDLCIDDKTDENKKYLQLFPLSYSLTYTFLTAKELQFDNKASFMIITETSAPSLYKIATSLKINKNMMDIYTNYDLLITSDDEKYSIVYNPITNVYKLMKF